MSQQTAYVACYVESGVNTNLVGEVKCECKHCEPIPSNSQSTQYNAPIEMGTSTSEPSNSSLSYWEYESIQSRCVRLQEKCDELRHELEREVKLKLETLSQMQKELAKGELAQARVEELIKERADLRQSLELARERAERVYFQKGMGCRELDETVMFSSSYFRDDYAQIYTSDSMKMEPSPTTSNPPLTFDKADPETLLNSNMSTTVDHVNSSVAVRQLPDLPDTFPGPIIGCICASCKTFFRSANATGAGVGNLGSLSGHPVIQSSIKKFKSDLNKLTLLRFDMKYFKWKSNSGQKAFKHG